MLRLKSLVLGTAGAVLSVGVATHALSADAPELEADVILSHGDIYTPDGWAQAMAI